MSNPLRTVLFCLLICFWSGRLLLGSEPGPRDTEHAGAPKLTIFQAVVLGFVEGATEYLPVSSTGHLLIVQSLMGMDDKSENAEAAQSLAICIQSGAILAVLILYFGRIRQIVFGVLGRDAEGRRLLIHLVISFFPAAVIGLLFDDWIKDHLFGLCSVSLALLAGGVVILQQTHGSRALESDAGKELRDMVWSDALLIGVLQCVAFWPGFSRSLATILGCRVARLKMLAAVEYSFLLGLVTLSAATAYEGLRHGGDLIAIYGILTPLIALVIAFVAAVASVRFMISALTRHGLRPFGYYRVGLGLLCLVWFLMRSR